MATLPQLAVADVFQLTGDESNALFDKAKASVVQVRSGDAGFVSAGTGFFIDDQGTVLTSSTILGDNNSARVVINGVEMDAKILGNDPRSGLTMLRVSYGASPALPLAHSSALASGDGVMTIGFPLNLPVSPSQGPVSGFDGSFLMPVSPTASGKDRDVAAIMRFATTHIHANVPISPGQLGGPLLNAHGEVVGLIATSPDYGRSVYALPVEAIAKLVADFNKFGHAKYGWVGVNVAEVPDLSKDGRTVRVGFIAPGTPASESGLRAGDTVMRIDAREIYRPADVLDASFFSTVGTDMHIVVRRDDKLFDYSFAIIERPATTTAITPPVATSSTPTNKHIAADPR